MSSYANVNIPLEIWGALFCFITAGVTAIGKTQNKQASRTLCSIETVNGLLLLVQAASWYFRANPSTLGYYMSRVTVTLDLILDLVVEFLFAIYIYYLVDEHYRKENRIFLGLTAIVSATAVLIIIISLFNKYAFYFEADNSYVRGSGFYTLIGLYALQLIILFVLVVSKKKYIKSFYWKHLVLYTVIAVLAVVLQSLYYGIDIINTAITICILIAFYNFQMEQAMLTQERDYELERLESELVLAQVRPHFIYNTLNTIKFLCHEDPKEAMVAVDELAVYLRNNTDNLSSDRTETMEECVQNIDNYIAICKRRFGDRLNIEYDIKNEDIEVPAFTVQPLVENALKHGILKKPEGGTITISAWSQDNKNYIEVKDDGVGFDTDKNKKPEDGRRHVGVKNVETRINKLAGGELIIKSKPGEGTVATIILPQKFDIKHVLREEILKGKSIKDGA